MTNDEIYRHIDHTLLKPCSTMNEIFALCDEAIKYHTAAVCIPPSFVSAVKQKYGDTLKICTVIGFPLGYSTGQVKALEAVDAVKNGADEIDMVINLGYVKDKKWEAVCAEIAAVRTVTEGRILKVIIETCYLDKDEKIKLSECVTNCGADYIKTSTGFGTRGAVIDDIAIMRENIGKRVKIKAAGGVKTRQDLEMFLSAGCDRIGTSSAVKILAAEEEAENY